jgi:RimJ/RimL family protein N-acetyltransferase
MIESVELPGRAIRLEPLNLRHVDRLVAAAATDPSLYQWSPVPQGRPATVAYIETALEWLAQGTAVPFAIVDAASGEIIGSTRFFNIERWAWPPTDPGGRRGLPDACEIGYTWLRRSAVRTGVNTEAKLLMLTHAFEVWRVLRVCLHTDERNRRSWAAIERIGGQFEGILRAHRLAADFTPRNSARFSILAAEWPTVKERLTGLTRTIH